MNEKSKKKEGMAKAKLERKMEGEEVAENG